MPISTSDYFAKVGSPGNATSLASPGHSIGGTSFTVDSTALWPTDTKVTFAIDTVTITNGVEVRDVGSYTVWDGIVTNGTTIGSAVLRYGTDQNYPAGSTTRVYILPTSTRENKIIDGLLVEHDQDGTHGAITASSITATTGTFDTVVVSGTATSEGWSPLGDVPDLVTANGNRNYDIVFNGEDHTDVLSPGMKMQLSRTVAAPDQCADLEASSSQYFSRTGASVAGMTFTDDFVVSAWVKLESYTSGTIASRFDGSSGWIFDVLSTGQVALRGYNASVSNQSNIVSYASLPLNKWVHVAAQLDMSAFTATTTTSYIMFDGVDVPGLVARSGTNPTTLAQAGDLRIGSTGGGTNYFDGKIAQVAIYSAKVTQANILLTMSQGLSGSETSLISAWSLDGVLTDLNANGNTLTANGGAAATDPDSPFANAVTAGLLEYAEVNSVTFSTNTTVNVRVPDTCQIPTSGGVSAVSYSTQSNPYGLPTLSSTIGRAEIHSTFNTTTTGSWVDVPGLSITVYVPTSRLIKLIVHCSRAGSTGNVAVASGVLEGATLVSNVISSVNNSSVSVHMSFDVYATAGSHTYKVACSQNGAGTMNFNGGVGGVAGDGYTFIKAELV